MTIDELYRFVQYVSNKEQRGFIKPSEFDLLAKRSQLDLIKDRVGKPSSASKEEGYKPNSAFFDELYPVISLNVSLSYSNDSWNFPANYLYFLGCARGSSSLGSATAVEIVNAGQFQKRVKSPLAGPSAESPIGLISSIGIRVFTSTTEQTTGTVTLSYIKTPADPKWDYVTVNNIEVYNANGSTELTLPESAHLEIAHRILTYVGVNLREADMVQYSAAISKE